MSVTKTSNEAERLAQSPLGEWSAACDQMPLTSCLDDELAYNALRYARAAAYVKARKLGRSHSVAVDAQNKIARTLRAALGFAYPEDNVNF